MSTSFSYHPVNSSADTEKLLSNEEREQNEDDSVRHPRGRRLAVALRDHWWLVDLLELFIIASLAVMLFVGLAQERRVVGGDVTGFAPTCMFLPGPTTKKLTDLESCTSCIEIQFGTKILSGKPRRLVQ
jgi:hypothetical protein